MSGRMSSSGCGKFNLHLNRGLLPVGFRRDFIHTAVIDAVRICVCHEGARLIRCNAVEIVLINIQFDLQIAEIGKGDDEGLRAAIANKRSRDHLALLDVALENSAVTGTRISVESSMVFAYSIAAFARPLRIGLLRFAPVADLVERVRVSSSMPTDSRGRCRPGLLHRPAIEPEATPSLTRP